jgi:hypothetical protein
MWWYDEYAVNVTTGASSTSLTHTGWLGEAMGPAYQMIWVGTGSDAVSNSDFEQDVTTGWQFNHSVPASLNRDVTTAAKGTASARIHIDQAQPVDYSVGFSTVNKLSVITGQTYSATFWAKASQARQVTIAAGSVAARTVDLTTQWKQYQITLVPYTNATVSLQFFLAIAGGDVWLDDVHFQAGTTSLYRRDFQNGTVLVNPGATAQTVPLEQPYRRLLGIRDLTVNNGATVNQVTVGSSEALFLLGTDVTPPAAVTDLRFNPRIPTAPVKPPPH